MEPWSTDGSTAGTRLAADVAPGPRHAMPLGFVALGDAVLFVADDGLGNERLWSRSTKGGARRATLIGDPLRERLR